MRNREDFLEAAGGLFAERGFYGVSLAQIAAELEVTKQAVIHRFGTKEKLYGEVLQGISERIQHRLETALGSSESAEDQLVSFFRQGWGSNRGVRDARLLVRELLDNKRRAPRARTWYLGPFLDALIDLVQRVPGWQQASRAEALAVVYQLLGADSYFQVSSATLRNMFGDTFARAFDRAFPEQLEATVRAALARPPSG